VDFVLEKDQKVVPIEVKSNLSAKNLTRSFQSFLEKYRPPVGFSSSSYFEEKLTVARTKIQFVPHVKLLSQINKYWKNKSIKKQPANWKSLSLS